MKKISNGNAEYNGNEEDEFVEEIELMDFMDCLFRTPTLGSAHSAGKKIMEVIRNIWKSSSSVNKIGFDEDFYYHSKILLCLQNIFYLNQILNLYYLL